MTQHVQKLDRTMHHLPTFRQHGSLGNNVFRSRREGVGRLAGANYEGVVYATIEMFGLYPVGNKELWPITKMDQDSEEDRFLLMT